MLQIIADEHLLLQTDYHKQRHELTKQHKGRAADRVWQFDFSEYETTSDGT